MREILFKARRLDNGDWVEGYLVRHPSTVQIGDDYSPWYIHVPPTDPDDSGGVFNVDPSTVCQYTGLTDKNGKKIFKGDIVKTKYGRLCVVCFKNLPGFSGFDLEPVECVQKAPDGYDLWERENLEVIGSIHDGADGGTE